MLLLGMTKRYNTPFPLKEATAEDMEVFFKNIIRDEDFLPPVSVTVEHSPCPFFYGIKSSMLAGLALHPFIEARRQGVRLELYDMVRPFGKKDTAPGEHLSLRDGIKIMQMMIVWETAAPYEFLFISYWFGGYENIGLPLQNTISVLAVDIVHRAQQIWGPLLRKKQN